jgi:hypothetical protein
MNVSVDIAAPHLNNPATSTAFKNGTPPSLSVIDYSCQPDSVSGNNTAYFHAIQSLDRSVVVYGLGGLSYGVIMTLAWMTAASDGFNVTRFLFLLSCYCWPGVMTVSLIKPAIRKCTAIIYGAIILFIAGTALIRSPSLTWDQLLYLWIFANCPGTALLAAFLNRRVRAVGPLVLAFMVAAFSGAVIIVKMVGSSDRLMLGVADVGSKLGLEAWTVFVLLHFVGFALFGFLGWQLLLWVGRRYKKKRMSDQSIMIDTLMLLFGVVHSFTLVFEGWGWIFTGLVAFAVFKMTVRFGFMFLARQYGNSTESHVLLLLRVFSLGRRSERLFDSISSVWLRIGSISLISGPDLATTTVEPHEFLDFMGGRLSRQFVQGENDLKQRLLSMDIRPDPDGRHRVNEFFCRADTWQMTMQQLARRSAAVLMDLRSFSKNNQGCIYELRQLMDTIPLDRFILAIDDSTDREFLETKVMDIWQDLVPESPNADLPKPVVRCFAVKKQGPKEMEKLLLMLFGVRTAIAC